MRQQRVTLWIVILCGVAAWISDTNTSIAANASPVRDDRAATAHANPTARHDMTQSIWGDDIVRSVVNLSTIIQADALVVTDDGQWQLVSPTARRQSH